MQRKYKNALVAGPGIFAFLASVGPLLLDVLSLHGLADDISATLELLHHPRINWIAWYLLAFFVSVCLAVAINVDVAIQYWRDRPSRKYRRWDSTGQEAVDHIATYSVFADPDRRHAVSQACNSLVEAARDGKIVLRGVRSGKAAPTVIPRRTFKNAQFVYERNSLISQAEPGDVLYSKLAVSYVDVRAFWPSRNSGSGW